MFGIKLKGIYVVTVSSPAGSSSSSDAAGSILFKSENGIE